MLSPSEEIKSGRKGNLMLVWCLFDGSGIMGEPWALNGHKVVCFNADDADHGSYAEVRITHPNIEYVNQWIDADFELKAMTGEFGDPDIIFAFPPCTNLAVSGTRHFASKAKADPLFQVKAVDTVKIAANIGWALNVPYMIENPVGRIPKLWKKWNVLFNPFDYGGYLPENDVNPYYPEYITARDAYPKKTCIWVGQGFVIPEKKPAPVNPGYSTQFKKLGGKSEKTKMIRSLTPRGFALAVYEANGK